MMNPNHHFVLKQNMSCGRSPKAGLLGCHHHRKRMALYCPSTGLELPLHMGLGWRGASNSTCPREELTSQIFG